VREISHCVVGEACDVNQFLGRVLVVDRSVGKEESATLGVENVESGEMLESRLDANHLFCNLHSVAAAGESASDEGVGLASFHHHHTEIVAVVHLFVGFGQVDAIALMLIHVQLGIACAAVFLAVVARVHDGDAFQFEVEFLSTLCNHFLVAQQNREADAALVSLHGCLEHIVGIGLRKHHTLWRVLRRVGKAAEQLVVVAQHLAQFRAVSVEVVDRTARHARIHGRFSHGGRYGFDQARVECLWKNIFRTEFQVVHLVGGVHHRWHVLFRQIGNSAHSRQLHCRVDFGGRAVDSATEDVGEAQHIVDLVGVVATSSGKNEVGS